MKLAIITKDDQRLRRKSTPIELTEFSKPKFQKFIHELTETMYQSDGIGIAAPQVGRNIRLIIIAGEKGAMTLINPVISRRSWRKETEEEGCLSVPGVYGMVRRSRQIFAQWTDAAGQPVKIKAAGLLARVIQHEVDHLDGILFIDRAHKLHDPKPGDTETRL